MKMLMKLLRIVCTVAGALGALACTWALIDPSIIVPTWQGSPFAPPSPRWRAAFGLVFSLALLGFGTGILRHRELP